MHLRESRTFWSALESDGRGMLSDSVTVWWMGRDQNKGREILEQRLRVLFGDPKRAVEWAQKGIKLSIASKVALPKCVIRACLLEIPIDIPADRR